MEQKFKEFLQLFLDQLDTRYAPDPIPDSLHLSFAPPSSLVPGAMLIAQAMPVVTIDQARFMIQNPAQDYSIHMCYFISEWYDFYRESEITLIVQDFAFNADTMKDVAELCNLKLASERSRHHNPPNTLQ